ncbi:uncharacterized protein N7518_006801 [Penicillium psychrosexuale]|uniref:uncharacterized protein n=1 Tax=Penicillium psychrosexuale TaxID=1002107 RepID=UPI002544DC41|nr:uncharacterized protein N7518_006801 [Penicillium psychrosexuale]KAJ5789790.1 hypothetical protein N7518_006801 [Penicillium psychrosexuale]
MKRYQQHTHASWHRAYTGKFDCPWCQNTHRPESTTPQSPNHNTRKPAQAQGSDNGRSSRANATPTPVGQRIAPESPESSQSSAVPVEEQAAGTPPEPQTPESAPESAPDANDEETPEPEPESNYTPYNMGRTSRHGNNASRPPLPEEWTKEVEDQEHG